MTPQQPKIVVLGGINMDLVTFSPRFPQPGETVVGSRFVTYAGGKGANQAVAAARMGARPAMVGRVGEDMFGPQLLDVLAGAGVDISGIRVNQDKSSGIAVIGVDETAQNCITQILGANGTCGPEEAQAVRRALPGASALLLQLEVSPELSLEVARAAHEMGVTVMLDPGPVRPVPDGFFNLCDVITPNETEAQALAGFAVTGPESAARAASELLGRGVGTVVVKLGAQGAYYASRNSQGMVLPFSVDAIDSVAAGDAFNGALAVSLSEGKDLPTAVTIACAAGALAVTKTGAQDSMPERRLVEELLRSQRA
ncbi:MAG: ribokinase [Chloroflexi bacterium]|nr:ribokinase [Chloroflexota bacterium]MDA1270025.1 ribokinase [Chloroflexota bacterium]PKB58674.1 MAG: ribokinase [SAR202 cluster bacterium Casp-Chloro-G2]